MQETVPTFGINEPLCTKFGNTLRASFVKGMEISLTPFRQITSTTTDTPSEHAGTSLVHIFHLQPEFICDDPILRSLLAESNSTFNALQMLRKSSCKSNYMKISRTYRSIIRACLEKLQDEATIQREESDVHNNYRNYTSLFYSIECVWHLSEILFLDETPTNVIVPQLLDWVRFHFPTIERLATDLLLLGREASESNDYWMVLTGLILQGRVDVTRALLRLHPENESTAYKMAEGILKTMPLHSVGDIFSLKKFRDKWQYWLADTKRKLATNIMSQDNHLEHIILLMIGDPHAWNTELKLSHYWYELLPGFLLYTNPSCKSFELGNIANLYFNRWLSVNSNNNVDRESIKHLDRIILNLMENNLHQVIHSMQMVCDNQWFVVHLTDLLSSCGRNNCATEKEANEYVNLRNSLLFDFGTCLMSRTSLWQFGMDYLEHSGEQGLAALELLLTRIPVITEKQALKLLGVAQRKGFANTAQEICKVQAKSSFDRGRYGNALEWAMRSGHMLLLTSIADFFLKHYIKTGDILFPDVLANIGSKMFIAPRLLFLVKYFEFFQLYKERDFVRATHIIIRLLESKITPNYFLRSMLIDTIPLLETKNTKLSSMGTCIILQSLQSDLLPLIENKIQHVNTIEQTDDVVDYRAQSISDIVNLLRLACARNLSRSIIKESCE